MCVCQCIAYISDQKIRIIQLFLLWKKIDLKKGRGTARGVGTT